MTLHALVVRAKTIQNPIAIFITSVPSMFGADATISQVPKRGHHTEVNNTLYFLLPLF
jgi:hypothetical protein